MRFVYILALPAFAALPITISAQTVPAAQVEAIAKSAYVYGFPLVDVYRIMFGYFIDPKSPAYVAPFNTLHNTANVYTPADTTVQTPNSDTPYSFLGLDLRAEPMVLTMPAIHNDEPTTFSERPRRCITTTLIEQSARSTESLGTQRPKQSTLGIRKTVTANRSVARIVTRFTSRRANFRRQKRSGL
jgi:hypothetical protein